MPSWLQRVASRFGAGHVPVPDAPSSWPSTPGASPRGEGAPGPASSAPAVPPPRPAPVASVLPDMRLAFFGWLLDLQPERQPLTARESRLLRHLDTVTAADASRDGLLPRAAGVIPQLMRTLRDAGASSGLLASRIAPDPNLVAEVVRRANGAAACGHEPVTGLSDAIARVGVDGLKQAIAAVLLKPVFEAPVDSLSGRAARRLWAHSEAQADEAARLAGAAGLDPFDGYLAGLLHNIGWSASLRALDRYPGVLPDAFTVAFVEALEPRRETLFALLAMPWQLSDPLTALAVELLDVRLEEAGSPLAAALRAADRHAAFAVLGAGALFEPIGS